MSDHEKNNLPAGRQGNISSLIVGIVIGAAVTYLFTNKEGQKLKNKLLAEGEKLLSSLRESLEEVEEETKEAREEIGQKLSSGVEEVKEKVEEEVTEIPKHIEQIQKKGRRFFFRRSHTSQES
ncbi:hypothetical protein A3D81_00020 [Candidatus Curtissbacteria bacterium RIFCSPHIGHO2_02_FULL_40_17]|uniref:YtxH domain-containing protein n=4 Tax=Candidatus Curtissiibacteriota TaxID=1752717 RepID=A0A1F5GGH5_9BACT|nr:MAG: hypothetical protein A2693_00735 [Candidatus Curtissbacteria bacterium RIFCSPHIGHO2_01_FULL_40_12]OGD90972.1 MAG: hypothetical protein A3D81_00020 [Candidatus Curtissbacteria bacterium RIFCSPHIGHO2_02_FULL_40_17]OGE05174.1 MAG: hypothetical protein A3F45_01725 [Candidatus Curtissbacteria bacterium RIFCSPHIGHO2_12_FULL_41_17]OGE07689.1 MAG: hypothetical protein A3I53_02615 [Candidatus Curtissbacteria bacterium RIFCSPLOWO2_02_FULL_40_13b]